jgi:hypothetical protein
MMLLCAHNSVYALALCCLAACVHTNSLHSLVCILTYSCHENQDYHKSSNHVLHLERDLWDMCLWYLACVHHVQDCVHIKQVLNGLTNALSLIYFCSRRWNWGHRLCSRCSIQRDRRCRIQCRTDYYAGSCICVCVCVCVCVCACHNYHSMLIII